jgi:hypothetical protein
MTDPDHLSSRLRKRGHSKLADDALALELQLVEVTKERDRYRERLQFDPGGSDKIDELEAVLAITKNRLNEAEAAEAELKRLKPILADLMNAMMRPPGMDT